MLAPGNPTVCRTLPYVGQYVTCLGREGGECEQPVQVRPACDSDAPGWVPVRAPRPGPAGLTSLQVALVAAGASLVAACAALGCVLVVRRRDVRRWQTLKAGDGGELGLVSGAAFPSAGWPSLLLNSACAALHRRPRPRRTPPHLPLALLLSPCISHAPLLCHVRSTTATTRWPT